MGKRSVTLCFVIILSGILLNLSAQPTQEAPPLFEQSMDLQEQIDSIRDEMRIRYQVGIDRISFSVNILIGAITVLGVAFAGYQIIQTRKFGERIKEAKETISDLNTLRDQLTDDAVGITKQKDRIDDLLTRVTSLQGHAEDILSEIAEVFRNEISTFIISESDLGMSRESAKRTIQYATFLYRFGIPLSREEHYIHAIARYNNADSDGAISELEEMIDKGVDDPKVLFSAGLIYQKRGEFPRARELYDTVLRSKPKYVPALINKAILLTNDQEFEPAVNMLLTAYDLDPENINILVNLSDTLFKAGDIERARDIINIAKDECESDSETYYQLIINEASIEVKNGNIDEAVRLIKSLPHTKKWKDRVSYDLDLKDIRTNTDYIEWVNHKNSE